MHRPLDLLLGLLIALVITGCSPAVSNKDLGTIIYDIPHVQGADKPYEMPKLKSPTPEVITPDLQKADGANAHQPEAQESLQAITDSQQTPKPNPAGK
jgi:hypothetical protein